MYNPTQKFEDKSVVWNEDGTAQPFCSLARPELTRNRPAQPR